MPRLAQVIARFGEAYLRRRGGRLPAHQHKALRALQACRTRRLGGIRRACTHCGHAHVRWHSCRNRHCPRCQHGKQREWTAARLRELPPVSYAHLVFTVPAALAEHCRREPEALYRALFEAASQSVLELTAARHKVKPGLLAVLHTWGQNLHFHPHIHILATAGGLSEDGRWKTIGKGTGYFLPVRALSAIFRAKCFAALARLGQSLPAEPLPKEWVVHARAPQVSPGSILLYLARYVYRVALDESRLLRIDDDGVTFRLKDYRDNGKGKTLTLAGEEFLRRFLQHILPPRFVKTRHYGLFAHAKKKANLARVRKALAGADRQTAATTAALLSLLRDFEAEPPPVTCPRCASLDFECCEVPAEPLPIIRDPRPP